MDTGELILDDWQKEILDYDGNILLCTGRQVGKSTIFAVKASKYVMKHKGSTVIIVSLTEDQAKLITVMCLDYLEKHYPKQIKQGRDRPTQNRIMLKNGSKIIARPVGLTGDSIRGFTADVLIIDEAARMPELVWTASRPTLLTTEGQIWICSTPFGKQGYFWEAYTNKSKRYNVFHINTEEVINKRPINEVWTQRKKEAAINFLKQEKEDMSELQYGQEYLGLFLEDLRQFFPDDIIAKACILDRPEVKPKKFNFLGCDIARLGGDEITYEIIHKLDNKRYNHVENIVRKGQLTTRTEEDIIHLAETWSLNNIGIDAGSGALGVGIFDRLLENKLTKKKVIPMNNRTIPLDRDGKRKQRIMKEDFYENMLSMMEKGELFLLRDESVVMSLKSVQWELITRDGMTKMRIFGKDTHVAEGLIRSAWLAKKRKLNKLWITCR